MRTLVESLKRLYPEKVTKEKIGTLLTDKKITQEEYDYIVG